MRSVAEVAFLASNFKECVEFYRKVGLEVRGDPRFVNFSNVGKTLFGIVDENRGFFDPNSSIEDPKFLKPPICSRLHIAFEVPSDQLDDCLAFLEARGIKVSPKHEWENFHGVPHSTSVYFTDPEGNAIELWAIKEA